MERGTRMSLPKLIKYASEHYVFHYVAGSIAEKDIEKIVMIQENCFKDICKFLNIYPTFKIQYFLLETPELVGELYGDHDPCNGFANPPNEIYAVYNNKIKCIGYHEDAHIISYLINRPHSVFLREGLAMYFDKIWWNKSNEEWVRIFIDNNKYLEIKELLNNDFFLDHSDEITYPIAGAFIKYLIDQYGTDLFISIYKYKGDNLLRKIESSYTSKIEIIEKEFLKSLSNNNL